MPMNRTFSLLFPTHNRGAILIDALKSVAEAEAPRGVTVEVLVIANACTDDTETVVRQYAAHAPFAVRCVSEPQTGLSVARNRGLAESSGDIIAFLDDDVLVERCWLREMLAIFDAEAADIVGGKVTLSWDLVSRPNWLSDYPERLLSKKDNGDAVVELKSPYGLVGANFAFRRAVCDAVGRFSDRFGRSGRRMAAGEENDFLSRALAKGFRAYYAPGALVRHRVLPERVALRYLSRAAFGASYSSVALQCRTAEDVRARCEREKHEFACGLLPLLGAMLRRDRKAFVQRYCRLAACLGVLMATSGAGHGDACQVRVNHRASSSGKS